MLLIFLISIIFNDFGWNKIQYKDFHWQTYKTEHFEIVFEDGLDEVARFACDILERAYLRQSKSLRHEVKMRIPVIIYKSHNSFEQTNVIPDIIEESMGGFTVVFKSRVVVPFTGSYREFRHVLQHELTHVFQYSLWIGEGMINPYQLLKMNKVPLWVIEGCAEYFGEGWSNTSEMWMRDAIYNEKLIPITRLTPEHGFAVYKEGESIVNFIAKRYGEGKLGEIYHNIGLLSNFNEVTKKTLGISLDELDRLWRESLKERYWSICGTKKIKPDARRLTKHKDYIFNVSPAISPDGKEIAFLSDRGGYESLYLMSSITGEIKNRIIKGGRQDEFESMHLLDAKITFSPNGKLIAFVTKSRGKDRLVITTKKGKVLKKYSPELDGISHPAWSYDGKYIAFSGLHNGKRDIYVLELATSKIYRLTNDFHDDITPTFTRDGYIIFASDRHDGTPIEYGLYSLFKIPLHGGIPTKVFAYKSPTMRDPVVFDHYIFFVADFEGVNNLYVYDISKGELNMLTDVLTGTFTPSISHDGKYLVMSVYLEGGWDIFLMRNPLDKLKKVTYEAKGKPFAYEDTLKLSRKKLGIRFAPDWGFGALTVMFPWGVFGELFCEISDLVGDHSIFFALWGWGDSPNLFLQYLYQEKRMDFALALWRVQEGYVKTLTINNRKEDYLYLYETYEAGLFGLYPFDKFRRIEFGIIPIYRTVTIYSVKGALTPWGYEIEEAEPISEASHKGGYVYFGYVEDNTWWGSTGPSRGTRVRSELLTHLAGDFTGTYTTFDLRKYFRIAPKYYFAMRLGDLNSWENDSVSPFDVSQDPIRCAIYTDTIRPSRGRNLFFTQFEFRFPFIEYMKIAVPPIKLRNLRAALFLDAWVVKDNPLKIEPYTYTKDGIMLKDLHCVLGIGLRWRTSYGVIKIDYPFEIDLQKIYLGEFPYISIGSEW